MTERNRIDRDALHRLLWRRTDRLGRLFIQHGELAEETGFHISQLSRLLSEMERQGRIRYLSGGLRYGKTYVITDPALFHVAPNSDAVS